MNGCTWPWVHFRLKTKRKSVQQQASKWNGGEMELDCCLKELQSSTRWHYLQDWSCRSPPVRCSSTEKLFCILKKNNKIKVEKLWGKKDTLTIVLNRHISKNEHRYQMRFKDWLKDNGKLVRLSRKC